MDEQAFYRVGIVAAPKFSIVFQCFVVAACAAAGAKHHGDVRVFRFYTFQHFVNSAYMIDVKLSLLVLQIRRIDVGDRRVTVPFEECHFRILSQNLVYYAEYEVLYFRVAEVKNQLVAVVICLTVRQGDRCV